MKKLTTNVTDKSGKQSSISVFVDDLTAELLSDQSENFLQYFIEFEHNQNLVERKETRRHQSLDKSIENGFDIRDILVNIEDDFINKEKLDKLHFAINELAPKQRWLVEQVFFYNVSVAKIAEKEGVSRQAIHNRLKKIYKKMKKYLI